MGANEGYNIVMARLMIRYSLSYLFFQSSFTNNQNLEDLYINNSFLCSLLSICSKS